MGYGGGGSIYIGKDLLNLIESGSNNSSPYTNSNVRNENEQVKGSKGTTVNKIIINNYSGNVLKNLTNLEPYASQMQKSVSLGSEYVGNQNKYNFMSEQ